ncbi:nucleotidyltransferase domain-containing protein [Oscillospiraceae bacterium OttesenSCG-928-F05]|nr:nucleotidyltransferase domain-containing protein [Oscillospiraceae bacterium OttesenSCG-928-F05]
MAERDAEMNEASRLAKAYAGVLNEKLNVIGVYLFGSFAKGTAGEDSDIDIAVVSDSFTGDPIDDRSYLLVLKYDVDLRIEPHPFLPEDFTEDNPFAREILRTGIRIA